LKKFEIISKFEEILTRLVRFDENKSDRNEIDVSKIDEIVDEFSE
jgi:hypothetical protein